MDTRRLAAQIIQLGSGEEPGKKKVKGESRSIEPTADDIEPLSLVARAQDTPAEKAVFSLDSLKRDFRVKRARAHSTLNSIGDAVASTDISGRIAYLNLKAEELTGWSLRDAIGRAAFEVLRIVDANSREPVRDYMGRAARQNRTLYLSPDCVLIRRDGSDCPVEDSAAPIHDHEGVTTGAVIVFRDVNAAQAVEREISRSAQYDFLTGLPNRMLLNDRVTQAITMASRHTKQMAVLFVDLNGFKKINDSLGHATAISS